MVCNTFFCSEKQAYTYTFEFFLREWVVVEQIKTHYFSSFCVSQLSLPYDTFRSEKYSNIMEHLLHMWC